MSKHVKTLSVIGSAIASWSNGITASAAARKTLLAQCEKLTLVEKQRVDGELVGYYALQAGVGVKSREKAHALFCDSVPAWEKNEKGQVSHPAAMALSRARGVLFAKEKDTPAARGTKNAAKTPKAPKFTLETLLPSIGDLVASIGDGKISAAQKREVRQAATLLLGLINA